jgi:2-dehydropantoate 2-reductase
MAPGPFGLTDRLFEPCRAIPSRKGGVRYIVYGLGAIGGAVAANLAEAGAEVAGVARGAHLVKTRADGLRLLTPTRETTVRFPVADDPAALDPGPDDVVILAVKGQDTAGALAALRAANRDVAVACFQNGVANERAAARYFERVYGVVVMCPATHMEPGVVAVHSARVPALFDIGRFPAGLDAGAEALAGTLAAAGFDTRAVPDVMRWKHTKLLLNLGNAVEALIGGGARDGRLVGLARQEGMACLEAAGIPFASAEEDRRRRGDLLADLRPAGGQPHLGSSMWQSLARETGTVEADWLNGEIVLLGRLVGYPTPINACLQRLVADLAASMGPPGMMSEDEILAAAAP